MESLNRTNIAINRKFFFLKVSCFVVRRKDFEKVLRSRLNEGKTLNSYTTVVIFLYSNVYVRIQVAPLVRRAVSFRPITEPFAVFNKKNREEKKEKSI